MKRLLFVVVPNASTPTTPFGIDDQHAVDALRRMFGKDILDHFEVGLATYGGNLATKYAMVLTTNTPAFLHILADNIRGHFGLTITTLCRVFEGSEDVLCVFPANIFSISVAQGLVKAFFDATINDLTLRQMEATTHGAFLFTVERKGVPVIVSFPPRLPEK